jgi:tripartite-type tricarboxylate transporter receptor subunit TctC
MHAFIALLSVALTITVAPAQAQSPATFPNKPVRIVVPYTPGGGTDSALRGLTPYLSKIWSQPVVIENRPGGGSIIGADVVAKAPADGYTLLFSDSATYVINPHLYPNMPYDPARAFAPITIVCKLAPTFASPIGLPVKSLVEFIAHARANPGKLAYGSFGNGSYAHVATANFARQMGLEMTHVPYKGGAPAVTDLVGGQIALMFGTISIFEQQARAGKVRLLAVAAENRLANHPNLPTASESGVAGFVVNVWFGLAAPAGTPSAVLDRIHSDVISVLDIAEYRERQLIPQSLEKVGNSRASFSTQIDNDSRNWAQWVKTSGAKVE